MNDSTIVNVNSSSNLCKPSDFILPFEKRPRNKPALIVARVSGRFQRSKGNLDDQIDHLLSVAKAHKIEVAGVIPHTGSGKQIEWLSSAIEQAKPINAFLLAESMDRLMRPRSFSLLTKNSPYSPQELQRLQEMLDGVITVTLIHPDTKYTEVISSQTKRGLSQKESRGVGFRKRRRELMMEEAVEMNSVGFSTREIAYLLSLECDMKVSHTTIANWLRETSQIG